MDDIETGFFIKQGIIIKTTKNGAWLGYIAKKVDAAQRRRYEKPAFAHQH